MHNNVTHANIMFVKPGMNDIEHVLGLKDGDEISVTCVYDVTDKLLELGYHVKLLRYTSKRSAEVGGQEICMAISRPIKR